MLSDEERAWFEALQSELYPVQKNAGQRLIDFLDKVPPTVPRERITHSELDRVCELIRREKLVTVLFPWNAICGVGMHVFAQEDFKSKSSKPAALVSLKDEHLPNLKSRTWHEHLLEVPPAPDKKREAGDVDPDAWEFFTSFTHSKENRQLLEKFKIQMRFEKFYYDY